jgi:ABC-type sugar transport system permease subunit
VINNDAQLSIDEQRKKLRWKKRFDRNFFVFCFLAFPVLNFLVFYLYVNIDSFVMAFQRPVYGQGYGATEWGIDNFKQIFNLFQASNGGALSIAFRNTIIFYVAGMMIGMPISILMSYFIYKKIACYKMFRMITYLPNIITSSALVVLFKNAIGPGGPLDAIYTRFGWEYIDPITQTSSAIWTILFYTVSFGFGMNMIVLNGAMLGINQEMLEAAELDGCNWFQELIYIIVPTIWPTVATIVMLATAGFLGSTGPILAFTKGTNETMTLSFYIYQLVSGAGTGKTDLYLASALGILMTAVSFPIAMVVKRVLYGKEETA